MERLKTTFAGLDLKNPFIVSSSGLTDSAEKNRQLEQAGAGAIVLKSLFEEQIMWQAAHHAAETDYPEAGDYLQGYLRAHYLDEYTRLVKETKKVCTIPVIASINCYTDREWEEYAKVIEQAGADAIELNLMALQASVDYQYGSFEQRHIDILKHVREQVHVPVIVKLGSNLTNPVKLIAQLQANGAAAVVLFNRFYHTNIDIDKLEYTAGHVLSHESELANSLRWIGIASGAVGRIDYAASGGVTSGRDIVKSILVGASAVEVCSALYKEGAKAIYPMLEAMRDWMALHGYETVGQFKGMMAAKDPEQVNAFERTQFMKYFGEKK